MTPLTNISKQTLQVDANETSVKENQSLETEDKEAKQFLEHREEKCENRKNDNKYYFHDDSKLTYLKYKSYPENYSINGHIFSSENSVKFFVCRHLVAKFIIEVSKGSSTWKSDFLDGMKDLEKAKIILNQAQYTELEKEAILYVNSPNLQISRDAFGEFIEELAKNIGINEQKAFYIYLNGYSSGCNGHAIALYIKKEISGLDTVLSVGIYDPNESANVNRVKMLAQDTNSIRKINFKNLLCQQYGLDDEYQDTITFYSTDADFVSQHTGQFVHRNQDMESIGVALSVGNTNHINFIKNSLRVEEFKKHLENNSLLFGQHLNAAFNEGKLKAIEAFFEIVERAQLDKLYLKNILQAKSFEGVPVLNCILDDANILAIQLFGNFLIKANFDPSDLKDILLAKDPIGNSGLYFPASKGQTKVIDAFKNIFEKKYLDVLDLEEILLAKNNKGVSGLKQAATEYDLETVYQFHSMFDQFGLSKEKLKSIFDTYLKSK